MYYDKYEDYHHRRSPVGGSGIRVPRRCRPHKHLDGFTGPAGGHRPFAGTGDGHGDVAQFRVLVVLSNFGPLRMGELAQHVGANQSSFSRFADRMVAGGLIARSASPDNRREVIISLTEEGAKVYAEVTGARKREIAVVLEKLSEPDLDAVLAGFEVFARAAGEPSADDTLILGI